MFLMYLYNRQDDSYFNPEKIADDMNIDIMEVMGYISVLTDKGYLSLSVIKENNVLEEKINLEHFYEKISMLLIASDEDKSSDSILKYVENELKRPINTVEINMIENWLKNNIDESLIKKALNIAINDGVFSFKYIDSILFDWKSRGITNVSELENINTNKKDENIENLNNLELDGWDWLDDEDEYITN